MKKRVLLVAAVAVVTALTLALCAGCGGAKKLSLVSFDDEHIAKLQANNDFYSKATIAKDTYKNVDETKTVAVGAVILARDDVSEEAIYKFCADIFNNSASLVSNHAKYGELNLQFASSVTSLPYHPGAAKYFAEKGYTVASSSGKSGSLNSNLRFVTGGESGTYYAFGSVLAQHATNNAGVSITALSSGGSKANIASLVSGDAELAFCQSDVMAYAWNGARLFDESLAGYSVVAALYMEQVQVVTFNDQVKTIADLKGKKVSVGDVGSGTYFNAIDCLEAYGLTEKDITPSYQSFGDSANDLKDGKIDAAFIVAGAPTSAITSLAAE